MEARVKDIFAELRLEKVRNSELATYMCLTKFEYLLEKSTFRQVVVVRSKI